jgi:hypothetical protein
VLAVPALAYLGPYANVIYTLIVLLVVLMIVGAFYGTGPLFYTMPLFRVR